MIGNEEFAEEERASLVELYELVGKHVNMSTCEDRPGTTHRMCNSHCCTYCDMSRKYLEMKRANKGGYLREAGPSYTLLVADTKCAIENIGARKHGVETLREAALRMEQEGDIDAATKLRGWADLEERYTARGK